LLTDVVLKEGNGRQLAQQLSEAGCTFKVVYVSGYTPEAIIHRGILEPGIPFLQKPFGRQVLLDKIEEILVG
jgi:FixJ family two-component response regulator